MQARTRRWKARREKDPLLRLNRVGSAVEMITYEKTECKSRNAYPLRNLMTSHFPVNVLENETIHVDFKPLFQCIHIYTTLNSLEELQKSYQADRKVSF